MAKYFILKDINTLDVRVTPDIDFQPENSILVDENNIQLTNPRFNQYPNPTEMVEGFDENEAALKAIEEEYERYVQRKEDGVRAYLMIASELRTAKLNGVISDEEHLAIEIALEPVRAEVVLGQWIGAKQKLDLVGPEIIGAALYIDLSNRITNYINANY